MRRGLRPTSSFGDVQGVGYAIQGSLSPNRQKMAWIVLQALMYISPNERETWVGLNMLEMGIRTERKPSLPPRLSLLLHNSAVRHNQQPIHAKRSTQVLCKRPQASPTSAQVIPHIHCDHDVVSFIRLQGLSADITRTNRDIAIFCAAIPRLYTRYIRDIDRDHTSESLCELGGEYSLRATYFQYCAISSNLSCIQRLKNAVIALLMGFRSIVPEVSTVSSVEICSFSQECEFKQTQSMAEIKPHSPQGGHPANPVLNRLPYRFGPLHDHYAPSHNLALQSIRVTSPSGHSSAEYKRNCLGSTPTRACPLMPI